MMHAVPNQPDRRASPNSPGAHFPFELPGQPTLRDFIPGFDPAYYFSALQARTRDQKNGAKLLLPLLREELWTPVAAGPHSNADILDVATGFGFHLEAADPVLRNRICILDIQEPLLEVTRKLYPEVRAVRRDWRKTELPGAHFGAITGLNADTNIHTPEDLRAVFTEMYRLLIPGGKMILMALGAPESGWLDKARPPPGEAWGGEYSSENIIANFQRQEAEVLREVGFSAQLSHRHMNFGPLPARGYAPGEIWWHICRVEAHKPLSA